MACMVFLRPQRWKGLGFLNRFSSQSLKDAQDARFAPRTLPRARPHSESMQAWGALVVECAFPFSPSIRAKENVPQTRNLL